MDNYVEYLIIGGQRHGEIVSWPYEEDVLKLPNINHQNVGLDGLEPIEERFEVRRHICEQRGRTYLIASNTGFEGHDIDGLIMSRPILPFR